MKVGIGSVGLGPFSVPEAMGHLAQTAERCGFESVWAPDHSAIPDPHQSKCPYTPDGEIPGGPHAPLCEPITALSYVAALTSKIKLGTGIMILPQRHPFYVAKELATLDLVSKGRAILGIGSGWCSEEFEALGLNFHERGKRTDEAMQALRALWREDPSSFKGTHFNFERIRSFPKPVQKGGVPIVVGGHSRAAARRAARFGDGFYPLTPIVGIDVEDHRLPPGDQGIDRAAQGGMRQGRTQLRRLRHLDRSGARSRHDQAPRGPRRNARVHELRCHRSRRGDPLGGASRQ